MSSKLTTEQKRTLLEKLEQVYSGGRSTGRMMTAGGIRELMYKVAPWLGVYMVYSSGSYSAGAEITGEVQLLNEETGAVLLSDDWSAKKPKGAVLSIQRAMNRMLERQSARRV